VTQLQVAQLAASGMTNREIADRLFMSVHTVEAHLSSAYRALDIGSRRDLAWALRQVPDTIRDSDQRLRDSVSATDT
jgi:DNA-binding CsgD family transcriptional regulator